MKADIQRNKKISSIWIIPILTLAIGAWMTYQYYANKGTVIDIYFDNVEGIEAGKSKVKFKDVEIGKVESLRLSKDAEHVILSARITGQEIELLREDSKFWIVKPRIHKSGISGLSTLLSGSYITMSPGTSKQHTKTYTGLENPPITPVGTPGLHITLDSTGNQALHEGDPILFRGTEVGTIEYIHFNSDERRTYYNAFIKKPYDQLITSNTRFWFSNGIEIDLSSEGVKLDIGSLETVISGGVSFDTPEGQPHGEPLDDRGFFKIFPNKNAIYDRQYSHSIHYILLFDESIRGLKPGAPVEYRGIRIGAVVRTDTDYTLIDNILDDNSKIPVLIKITPGRLGMEDTQESIASLKTQINNMVKTGLTGTLALGSIITGQKYIEITNNETAPAGHTSEFSGYPVIPAVNNPLSQMLTKTENILETIEQLPFNDLANNSNRALLNASNVLQNFNTAIADMQNILADFSDHDIAGTLETTLNSFKQLNKDFSAGSITHDELQSNLQSLNRSLRELEPALRTLRNKPNSIIFGRDNIQDIEPKGAKQ